MATFTIDMKEGICTDCKKKTFVAPRGFCLACAAKRAKQGKL